jgi:hypothetical protein
MSGGPVRPLRGHAHLPARGRRVEDRSPPRR